MRFQKIAITAVIILFFASCHSSKTSLAYFNDIVDIEEGVLPELNDYKTVIKPDDELAIYVTSSIFETTKPYNPVVPGLYTSSPHGDNINYMQIYYIVDSQGDIEMPILGKIHVGGLTVDQAQDKIQELVRKDVSDAFVKVDLMNFNIYIAGEVERPSKINVKHRRYSIIDAIAEAGDLTPYGERSNILLIRQEDGKRIYKHLDLNSSDILTSPYFYLRQNDYIYVQPNKIKQSNSRYDTQNAYKLQVVSTIVSGVSVITSLIIALTIK